jgi:hypothetical protein
MGGWGEPHGPSQQIVARRVRNRAADCLADSAGLLLAAPTDENASMLREALRLYRLAQTEDET